jgi:hypothetical protein
LEFELELEGEIEVEAGNRIREPYDRRRENVPEQNHRQREIAEEMMRVDPEEEQ